MSVEVYDVHENIDKMRQEGIIPIDDYVHKMFFFKNGIEPPPYHEASGDMNCDINMDIY